MSRILSCARAKAFSSAIASFSAGVTGVVHKSMLSTLVELRDALSLNPTSHLTSYCSASKPLMIRFRPVGSIVTLVLPILSRHSVSRGFSSSFHFFSGGFLGIDVGQPFSRHSLKRLFFVSTVHATLRSRRSMRVSELALPRKRAKAPPPVTLDSLRCMLARVKLNVVLSKAGKPVIPSLTMCVSSTAVGLMDVGSGSFCARPAHPARTSATIPAQTALRDMDLSPFLEC